MLKYSDYMYMIDSGAVQLHNKEKYGWKSMPPNALDRLMEEV